jgi:PII-like signaling protein
MSQPQSYTEDISGERTALLRIFIDKFQKHGFTAAYIALVQKAHDDGLAGATVLEGIEGFGQNGKLLHDRKWSLSNNREVVIEIVDTAQKIAGFIEAAESWLTNAVITVQPIEIVKPEKQKPMIGTQN